MDNLYSFIMKGELTKVSLSRAGVSSKYEHSEVLIHEYLQSLSLDLLDDELVEKAKEMATVYTAIAAFENSVRRFIVKVLIEKYGDSWWEKHVSDKIKSRAETRKKEEEKIKWHTQRGESLINYTEFNDLVAIMTCNHDVFEDYIVSLDWARQVIQTIERSRNVIMHSGMLGRKDIERIGTNIRDWISQIGD